VFIGLADMEKPATRAELPTYIVIPAFALSELRAGFIIGFFLFIPFIMVDMIISSILMSMGMMMLPPMLISLPFKILLFVLVDGWNLIVGSVLELS
jgi:flagellar biosynthetic protein FliP